MGVKAEKHRNDTAGVPAFVAATGCGILTLISGVCFVNGLMELYNKLTW